jgi:EAL domain-containing protein (putative c-di-GMP-specific phosphodiesterase class I)
VLCLHPDTPGIDGWEALARTAGGPEGIAAPEIHTAAELWGREFMQLLDQRVLHVAVRDYLVQIADAPRRVGGLPMPLGLTVNVHPDTLFADEYLRQVQDLVAAAGGIRAAELALEVSGTRGLSRLPPGEPGGTTAAALLERLAAYHEGLGIGLVIDDVGAGAATMERLPGQGLTYAKLDPWILDQPDTRLAAGVIASALASPRIGPGRLVVEGFADRRPFRLEDAFAVGVRFVQGPFAGDPSRELRMGLAAGQAERIRRAADRVHLTGAGHAAASRRPGFGRVG